MYVSNFKQFHLLFLELSFPQIRRKKNIQTKTDILTTNQQPTIAYKDNQFIIINSALFIWWLKLCFVQGFPS